jgi:hypothetical protein
MSLTVTKEPGRPDVIGALRATRTEVTLDSSYTEGGEPLTAAQLGLRLVDRATCTVKHGSEVEATAVGSVVYDQSAGKLIVNDYKTQKPMVKEKDLSKVVVIVDAWGR